MLKEFGHQLHLRAVGGKIEHAIHDSARIPYIMIPSTHNDDERGRVVTIKQHGDEFSHGENVLLQVAAQKKLSFAAPTLMILDMSPQASKTKTRGTKITNPSFYRTPFINYKNPEEQIYVPTLYREYDQNRGYGRNFSAMPKSVQDEIASIQTLLTQFHPNVALHIHTDNDLRNEAYMYVQGDDKFLQDPKLQVLIEILHNKLSSNSCFKPYSGIDDPIMREYVNNGILFLTKDKGYGTIEEWGQRSGAVECAFTLEVPGLAPSHMKQEFLHDFVSTFLTYKTS